MAKLESLFLNFVTNRTFWISTSNLYRLTIFYTSDGLLG